MFHLVKTPPPWPLDVYQLPFQFPPPTCQLSQVSQIAHPSIQVLPPTCRPVPAPTLHPTSTKSVM